MTAISRSSDGPSVERLAKTPVVEQSEQGTDAPIWNDIDIAARSTADVVLPRLLVEIQKVMFAPLTNPIRIQVMADKRQVLALVRARRPRPS